MDGIALGSDVARARAMAAAGGCSRAAGRGWAARSAGVGRAEGVGEGAALIGGTTTGTAGGGRRVGTGEGWENGFSGSAGPTAGACGVAPGGRSNTCADALHEVAAITIAPAQASDLTLVLRARPIIFYPSGLAP
ncbi:MAG: hypothetical protein ABW203_08785 [Novosphingobium sp.]